MIDSDSCCDEQYEVPRKTCTRVRAITGYYIFVMSVRHAPPAVVKTKLDLQHGDRQEGRAAIGSTQGIRRAQRLAVAKPSRAGSGRIGQCFCVVGRTREEILNPIGC